MMSCCTQDLRRLFSLLALPMILVPSIASATVVRALSLAEKTGVSGLVVHAIVERVESDWDLPGQSANTSITLLVIESLKGDVAAGERVIMRQGGGHIGDF